MAQYSWWTQPQYADVDMPNNHLLEGARGLAKVMQCPFRASQGLLVQTQCFQAYPTT